MAPEPYMCFIFLLCSKVLNLRFSSLAMLRIKTMPEKKVLNLKTKALCQKLFQDAILHLCWHIKQHSYKRFCKLGKLSLIASHKLRMVSLWFTNLWSRFSLTGEGVRLRLNKKELLGTSGTSSAATVLTGSGVFSGFSSPELKYGNQVNVCPPKKKYCL